MGLAGFDESAVAPFGVAADGVDGSLVVHERFAVQLAVENPVRAVEPGIVEHSRCGAQSIAPTGLAGVLAEQVALTKVHALAIADQHVGDEAVVGRVDATGVDDRALLAGDGQFVQHLARLRVEAPGGHAAVEERRSAGDGIGPSVLYQHTARDRPGRLESAEGADHAVLGCRPEPPCELAVGCAEAVYPAVAASEQCQAVVQRGGRVHPAAGGVAPDRLSRLGVERMNAVRVDRRDEELALGDDRCAESADQFARPSQLQVGRHVRGRGPASAGVVTVRWPVGRLRIVPARRDGLRIHFGPGGAAFEAGRLGSWVRGRGRCQGDQAVEFAGDVTVAGVRSGVEQAVAGHAAQTARAANPVVQVRLARGPVDQLEAAEAGHQVPVRGLVAVTSMVMPVGEGDLGGHAAFLGACGQVQADHGHRLAVMHPGQAAGDEHVGHAEMAPVAAGLRPERLAGLGRIRPHARLNDAPPDAFLDRFELAEQHGPIGGHQRAHVGHEMVVSAGVPLARRARRLPELRAGLEVQCDHVRSVQQVRAIAPGSQQEVCHAFQSAGLGAIAHESPGLPQQLARVGVDRGDGLGHRWVGFERLGPGPARFGVRGHLRGPLCGVVDRKDKHAVLPQDLVGELRAFIRLDDLARRGVQSG